jgi:hypothetical protein
VLSARDSAPLALRAESVRAPDEVPVDSELRFDSDPAVVWGMSGFVAGGGRMIISLACFVSSVALGRPGRPSDVTATDADTAMFLWTGSGSGEASFVAGFVGAEGR